MQGFRIQKIRTRRGESNLDERGCLFVTVQFSLTDDLAEEERVKSLLERFTRELVPVRAVRSPGLFNAYVLGLQSNFDEDEREVPEEVLGDEPYNPDRIYVWSGPGAPADADVFIDVWVEGEGRARVIAYGEDGTHFEWGDAFTRHPGTTGCLLRLMELRRASRREDAEPAWLFEEFCKTLSALEQFWD